MGKSLTETAKAVLLKEEPTLSATLKPGSKHTDPLKKLDAEYGEIEDLGPAIVKADGAIPSSKAADKIKKDKSKPTQNAKPAEPMKKISAIAEESDVEDELEISEELEAFIEKMIEEGHSDEEIMEAIDSNFELISEEDELDEDEEVEISEELEEFIDKMVAEGASEEEIEAAIAENFEIEPTEQEIEESVEINVADHVDALLEGEELSDEFKEKATTIFEAAVKAAVDQHVDILRAQYEKALNEEIEAIQEETSKKVDAHLQVVTERWIADNEVAIESGLRTELTEDFISGLKMLFTEHYIDIPEDKVDIVETLGEKVDELESRLNEEIGRNVELSRVIIESRQNEILNDACEGLTDTQAEKLKTLAEGITFDTEEGFVKKISTLKESYFSDTVKNDAVLDNTDTGENAGKGVLTEGRMNQYVQLLGKKLPQ